MHAQEAPEDFRLFAPEAEELPLPVLNVEYCCVAFLLPHFGQWVELCLPERTSRS